ncbi:TIGR04211 family SH3 domain-containing protein [Congregibacter brevis]|uniref:TIGR04211 family SH3 domain-containing protein n=1 Tax=Congregibacter brevis TaxID=3081201 RepID=A0ABZ0IFX8_9GAMM|nr:TIGR04211 family SH3 domain-containing protein [Congregibacter sp. IMCC45268]
MIRLLLILLLSAGPLLLSLTPAAHAQESRYISDEVFVVLHAGPGSNYRWIGKLIPGTELTEKRRSTDGNWAEVATSRGTEGWVQAEYLSTEPPAQVRLPAVVRQLEEAQQESAELRSRLSELQAQQSDVGSQLAKSNADLQQVSEELAQLRQISGSAVETAENNRRLVEDSATMRTTLDTLEADNQRLQDRVRSSAFMDGAFAVLLGVIITLVVPRLWPKRKSSSSWA